MIFTRDFVTRESYWQIASLVTQKSLFTVTNALFFISSLNMSRIYIGHMLFTQANIIIQPKHIEYMSRFDL